MSHSNQPQTAGIFTLSPSDFAFLWEECPACFYLKYRFGIRRPRTPMPKIFNVIDSKMNGAMDGQHSRNFAPDMPAGVFGFGQKFVVSNPIQPPGCSTGCQIRGRLDSLLELDQGGYLLLDFKCCSRRDEHVPLYARQLHAYVQCLENAAAGRFSAYPIRHLGLLIFEPESFSNQLDSGSASLGGALEWLEIPRRDDDFLSFLGEVVGLLESNEVPPPAESCQYCLFRSLAA